MNRVKEGSQKQYLVTDDISLVREVCRDENEEIAVFVVSEKNDGLSYVEDLPILYEISNGNLYYLFEEINPREIKTPKSEIKKLFKKTAIQ